MVTALNWIVAQGLPAFGNGIAPGSFNFEDFVLNGYIDLVPRYARKRYSHFPGFVVVAGSVMRADCDSAVFFSRSLRDFTGVAASAPA